MSPRRFALSLFCLCLAGTVGCGASRTTAAPPPPPGEGVAPEASPDVEAVPAFLGWRLEDCALGPITDAGPSRSAEALAAALGHEVVTESREGEGDCYECLVARFRGEVALTTTRESGVYVIRTPRIAAAGSLRVGAVGSEVLVADDVAHCLRGGDDSAEHVYCSLASLPSVTLVFEHVPVPAGDECVTDCPVDRAILQSERVDALAFRPCEADR